MEDQLVTMKYIHSHECSRRGQECFYRPICRNGVAEAPVLICIETGNQLEFKSIKKV